MSTAMSLRAFNDLFPDEGTARAWFERARWPNGPECYYCGVIGNAAYMPKTKFWHCKACKKQFSITAGTPMHRISANREPLSDLLRGSLPEG